MIRDRSNVLGRDIAASIVEIEEQEETSYMGGGEAAVIPFSLTEDMWDFSRKACTRYRHSQWTLLPSSSDLLLIWIMRLWVTWEKDKYVRMIRPLKPLTPVCLCICERSLEGATALGINRELCNQWRIEVGLPWVNFYRPPATWVVHSF